MPGIQESDRHQHIGIPEKLIKEPDSGKEKEQIMELLPESVFETALTVSFFAFATPLAHEEFASELFISMQCGWEYDPMECFGVKIK